MVYRTLAKSSQGTYKEKSSKFLAYAYPVGSVEQVYHQWQELKGIHHKARHHCYAYVLGPEGSEYRVFDDGEPKHSAGDPILGQLRAFELTNTLVVVVRYFGGTKLGVGGLINAYREAAHQALEKATVIEKEPFQVWQLTFSYPETKKMTRIIKELALTIIEQRFEDQCQVHLQVPISKEKMVRDRLKLISVTKIILANE